MPAEKAVGTIMRGSLSSKTNFPPRHTVVSFPDLPTPARIAFMMVWSGNETRRGQVKRWIRSKPLMLKVNTLHGLAYTNPNLVEAAFTVPSYLGLS